MFLVWPKKNTSLRKCWLCKTLYFMLVFFKNEKDLWVPSILVRDNEEGKFGLCWNLFCDAMLWNPPESILYAKWCTVATLCVIIYCGCIHFSKCTGGQTTLPSLTSKYYCLELMLKKSNIKRNLNVEQMKKITLLLLSSNDVLFFHLLLSARVDTARTIA